MSFSAFPPELIEMLSYKRPAWSSTEDEFINDFIRPLGVFEDGFGNLWKEVGEESRIMWSSHTDTVHRTEGRQLLKLDGPNISIKWDKTSNCLGADDASGVWLMTEMIRAEVPGLYIFHRDEEAGGNGSKYIAKEHPEFLKGIDFAIALDRKGYTDVITHQMGDRCCSDEFAWSLAEILGPQFEPSNNGVFTDTVNYRSLIPECANISVGYHGQHGPTETQNLSFLIGLRDRLIDNDFSTLICDRDPEDEDLLDYILNHPYRVTQALEAMQIDVNELKKWSDFLI